MFDVLTIKMSITRHSFWLGSYDLQIFCIVEHFLDIRIASPIVSPTYTITDSSNKRFTYREIIVLPSAMIDFIYWTTRKFLRNVKSLNNRRNNFTL